MHELNREENIQLRCVHIGVGLWSIYHFATLLPFSAFFNAEIWSFHSAYLICLIFAAVFVMLNRFLSFSCLFIWSGLVYLNYQNSLYYDIDLDYMGWLLLALALINGRMKSKEAIFLRNGFWLVLGVSYLASGIGKIQSEAWQSGDALFLFLSSDVNNNEFSINFLRFMGKDFLKALTWMVLLFELLFVFATFIPNTKKLMWMIMVSLHSALLIGTQLTEINVAVLIAYIFVFDVGWLQKKRVVYEV